MSQIKFYPSDALDIAIADANAAAAIVEVGRTRTEFGETCCVWGYRLDGRVECKFIVCDAAYEHADRYEQAV